MVTVFNKPISNETHIMTGATSEVAGHSGLVPAPAIGDQSKVLTGAGIWGLPGVVTINGRAPNPVTGDIVVIEGGGSSSYGSYRLDATITPSDWVANNGAYVAVVTNQYITSGMDGSETWLDNEYAQLGDAEFVSDTGTLTITTTVQPTENWNLHSSLAVNGADVLADVSAIRTNITEITTNLGSPSSASGVTGADAFSKIATLNGKFSPTLLSTDANNAVASGTYYLTSDCANRPADWCTMTVVAYDNNTLSQTATSAITGKTFVRSKSINGWTSWEELALNSNFSNYFPKPTSVMISAHGSINVPLEGRTCYLVTGSTNVSGICSFMLTQNGGVKTITNIMEPVGFSLTHSGLTLTITNNTNYDLPISVIKFVTTA